MPIPPVFLEDSYICSICAGPCWFEDDAWHEENRWHADCDYVDERNQTDYLEDSFEDDYYDDYPDHDPHGRD